MHKSQVKKTVYLVRHGQSEDNAKPVFQAYDSPLSPKGQLQAGKLAERASHLEFEALIASPQLRAHQTAEAIAIATGHTIEVSELFKERIKPTGLDGKAWADEAAISLWKRWEESLVTPGLKIEDGENYGEIVARAGKALAYLENRPETTLLVVSHGHFLRTMVARILIGEKLDGELLRRFYSLASLENTAITVLQYRDAFDEDFAWHLWSLNDHAHFAE